MVGRGWYVSLQYYFRQIVALFRPKIRTKKWGSNGIFYNNNTHEIGIFILLIKTNWMNHKKWSWSNSQRGIAVWTQNIYRCRRFFFFNFPNEKRPEHYIEIQPINPSNMKTISPWPPNARQHRSKQPGLHRLTWQWRKVTLPKN